jgi:hypothetical protein
MWCGQTKQTNKQTKQTDKQAVVYKEMQKEKKKKRKCLSAFFSWQTTRSPQASNFVYSFSTG